MAMEPRMLLNSRGRFFVKLQMTRFYGQKIVIVANFIPSHNKPKNFIFIFYR